jgi:MFS family permease
LKADAKKTAVTATAGALGVVVLFGLVSLFADTTYEGARSLNGQFLSVLGASATAVGFAVGAGEFLGYALRFVTGYLGDRTRHYWGLTFLGYGVNLFAVPLLALAGRWEVAVGLIFAERIGKAIRSPARDTLLADAASHLGAGRGFGLVEALDQIGAVVGPLFVAGTLYFRSGAGLSVYHTAYAFLVFPALAALIALAVARLRFPQPESLESRTPHAATHGFSRAYWWYLAGAACVAAGFADFPLMAYHFQRVMPGPNTWIPLVYSGAMLVDAVSALVFGRLYDHWGLPVIAGVFAVAAFFAPLVFLGSFNLALAGLALWGAGLGAQESILKAAIVQLAPAKRRGTAYGLFHTAFGAFWLAGSATMGFLYDRSPIWLVVFSILIQLAAIPFFLGAIRALRPRVNPAA